MLLLYPLLIGAYPSGLRPLAYTFSRYTALLDISGGLRRSPLVLESSYHPAREYSQPVRGVDCGRLTKILASYCLLDPIPE